MSKSVEIRPEQIAYVRSELTEHVAPETVGKGWSLYYDRRVGKIRYRNGKASASVREAADRNDANRDVELDFDFFLVSACSCATGFCAHLVALFFGVCGEHGYRPEAVLKAIRTIQSEREAERKREAAVKKAKQAKQARQARQALGGRTAAPAPGTRDVRAELAEDSAFEDWHAYLENQVILHRNRHESGIFPLFYNLERSLFPKVGKWEKGLRELFQIYAYLFLLRKLELEAAAIRDGYRFRHYDAMNQVFDRMFSLNQSVDRSRLTEKKYKRILDGVAECLHEYVFSAGVGVFDWLYCYKLMWGGLLYQPLVVDKELLRVEKLLDEPADDKRKSEACEALAHFAMMRGEDAAAFELLDRAAGDVQLHHLMIYLRTFLLAGDKIRLSAWLDWCLPTAAKATQEEIGEFMRIWAEAHRKWGWTDPYIAALRRLLPYSADAYGELLLKLKRYRDWADVQLALDVSPLELDYRVLKAVQQADAGALLPLFHQAVERYIGYRNREGYRNAVLCMMWLSRCYKRLKRPDRWALFLEQVKRRYSRLRALHDLMKSEGIAG